MFPVARYLKWKDNAQDVVIQKKLYFQSSICCDLYLSNNTVTLQDIMSLSTPIIWHLQNIEFRWRLSVLQNFHSQYLEPVHSICCFFLSFYWQQMALANFTPPASDSFSDTFLQPRPVLTGVYQVVSIMVNRVVIKTCSASSGVLCQYDEDWEHS